MLTYIGIAGAILSLISVVLVALLYVRLSGRDDEALEQAVREELREELRSSREESARAARELREEVAGSLKQTSDGLFKIMDDTLDLQKNQLEGVSGQLRHLTESNREGLEQLRGIVEQRLGAIQQTTEQRLDAMRVMVDEKLQTTLEKRLGESFKLVSDRLEAVHRGLGEMQTLAAGVGDLKKVLGNVKSRGILGEIQCGAILEQVLTPDQYGTNVVCREEGRDFVEFAVKLPGPDDAPGSCVWLPVDSKFPQEDYLRLLDALDRGEAEEARKATTALVSAVKNSAKDIRDKYLNPPRTTDFGVMFLPTEGLYAEVLRQPGLVQELQQTYKVVVAGPTTFSALLNSLRMGFRTLAIERRAGEVWTILGAVKTEFGKFGDVLDKVKKQLETASNTIEQTGVRTRAIQRKLKSVEELPEAQSSSLLPSPEEDQS